MTKKSSLLPQRRVTKDLTEYQFSEEPYHHFKSVRIQDRLTRIFDIIGSLLLMIIFSPLFLIIAVFIKMDSDGPVLFLQKRCGKNGIEFSMYKFRTMVRDAEFLKKNLKNETDGPMFKVKCDPRITRVGRFLRNWSLDELPQCFNVLKGEMSLVGPRPLASEEMTRNYYWRKMRLSVKPGLTGLWQVKGRGSGRFNDWIKYDIEYVQGKSFLMDVKILFLTALSIFVNRGAC
ncbi:MAG: sugar transferase [wastewater metagenome]|nr:sugar transferase [Candidatus Loosdrechtia aerotolerans]